MQEYKYFDIKNPSELPTLEELNSYEQQYNELLNKDIPDEEKREYIARFGVYLFHLGDTMLIYYNQNYNQNSEDTIHINDQNSEVANKTLELGTKLLLKAAELGDSQVQKLIDQLAANGGYEEYGIPSKPKNM